MVSGSERIRPSTHTRPGQVAGVPAPWGLPDLSRSQFIPSVPRNEELGTAKVMGSTSRHPTSSAHLWALVEPIHYDEQNKNQTPYFFYRYVNKTAENRRPNGH